jgi:hypothetical protein
MTTSGAHYLGCTAILRRVRVCSRMRTSPTIRPWPCADAWRMAGTRGGIPHLYEVGHDVDGLVVLGDVLITGGLAWETLSITGPGPE